MSVLRLVPAFLFKSKSDCWTREIDASNQVFNQKPLSFVICMYCLLCKIVIYCYQDGDERHTAGSSLITSATATATASTSNWSSSTYNSGSYWGGYFGKSDTGNVTEQNILSHPLGPWEFMAWVSC